MQNYIYHANFSGNILIVGRTGCGKTYFTQKLAINRLFRQLNGYRMGIAYRAET